MGLRWQLISRKMWMLLASCVFLLLPAACSVAGKGDKIICLRGNCKTNAEFRGEEPVKKEEDAKEAKETKPKVVVPHTAEVVMRKLRADCRSCHGVGQEQRSYWPMPPEFELKTNEELKAEGKNPDSEETFDKLLANKDSLDKLISKIEADQFSVEVYQSIENNILGVYNGAPKAMPYMVKFNKEQAEDYARVLAWFQSRLPYVYADARSKYHSKGSGIAAPVDFQYKCTSLVSSREFLNRVAQDALGRQIRADEIATIQKTPDLFKDIDATVTLALRQKIVERLGNEWRNEFINHGLKQFSEKITSSGKIRSSKIIVDEKKREDIADEFFQNVKSMVSKNKTWKEILTSNKVFATEKTAQYYGKDCVAKVSDPANKDKRYIECTMEEPRGTFFTTLGFLSSKPSSMFFENNNYGRVAAMNEVIRGETLQPNTAGEKGDKVRDLPRCLVTKDWRFLAQGEGKTAPRGAAAVPASGNFCQGCHIGRQMAAGSIVFRPFGPIGEKITPDLLVGDLQILNRPFYQLSEQEALLSSYIQSALTKFDGDTIIKDDNNWVNLPKGSKDYEAITANVLADWLNIGKGPGQERGCVMENEKEVSITKVEDLFNYYVRDDLILARGLSRIIPRAISNLNATNQEIISVVTDSWKKSDGQLMPVIQSYFGSETYACTSTGEMK